ncbi:MAG: NusG domain II-containing protein [Ruminococcus sp.]|nr:NusG domain II-containing protein [Ruminococcus sp.]MBR1739082.1 NusG domain II-containing protein [Ruminococcus sp.]
MNRTTKLLTAAAAAIFLISAVWCAFILLRPEKEGRRVRIVQDGRTLYTFDLSKEKDRTIDVEYEGRHNIIEIKDGRIRVTEADCPDKICVHQGFLTDTPIVCMPNRLVIEFEDSGENDAVAG